jgi:2-alkyl-3-oxoalkanoate reductase
MMNVLVTGATGFLGSRLVAALARQGHTVRAFARQPKAIEHLRLTNVETVRGDLKDRTSLQRAVAGVDIVYHAAAAMRGSWQEFSESTIRGTEWMLELSLNESVKRFVQISSITVYDFHVCARNALIDESCPWEPAPKRVGPYVHGKIEAERHAFAYLKRGLPVVIVRPGIIYGPGGPMMHPHVGYFLTRKWFVLVGRKDGLLPIVYIDNVVDGIILAATCETAVGQAYNLIDEAIITRKEYLDRYRAAMHSPGHIIPLPLPLLLAAAMAAEPLKLMGVLNHFATSYGLAGQYKSMQIDAAKARRELGWRSRIGLEEALRRTFGSHTDE